MSSPGEWYQSLPPVCKVWGTACVLTTIGVQLSVIDPRSIYLDYPFVFKKFQIWRLLTNFCFLGGFSFPFVIRIMMMCVRHRRFPARLKRRIITHVTSVPLFPDPNNAHCRERVVSVDGKRERIASSPRQSFFFFFFFSRLCTAHIYTQPDTFRHALQLFSKHPARFNPPYLHLPLLTARSRSPSSPQITHVRPSRNLQSSAVDKFPQCAIRSVSGEAHLRRTHG